MADTPKRYEKLPGTGYRRLVPVWVMIPLFFVIGIFVFLLRGRRSQLWLGEDHLLMVEWDGAREYYKRFRYQDIQAVILRRTADGKIVNGLLAGVVVLFGAFGIAISDPVGRIIFLGIAGIFGIALLISGFAGPTCQCQLRTAVQTEELNSLGRVRNAQKALERLRPLINAAQGELLPGEITARMQELLAKAGVASPAIVNAPPVMAPPPAEPPAATAGFLSNAWKTSRTSAV